MRALQLLLLSVLGLRKHLLLLFFLFLSNGSAAIVTIVQHWGHNPPLAHPRRMGGGAIKGRGSRVSMPHIAGTMPIQMVGKYSRDSVNITINTDYTRGNEQIIQTRPTGVKYIALIRKLNWHFELSKFCLFRRATRVQIAVCETG